jgi:tetratricopeptide (TPR) repeat protein
MRLISFIIIVLSLNISCNNAGKEEANKGSNEPFAQSVYEISSRIDQNPESANLYAARARIFYENEGFDNAIGDLEMAVQLDSLNEEYYHILSDIYLEYFKSKRAILTLERGAAVLPDPRATLIKLAETYLIVRQYDEAFYAIDRLVERDPLNGKAYFLKGLVYQDQGDMDKTINALQTSVELDAEQIDAWVLLGEIMTSQEDPKAMMYFENALRVDSTSIYALHSKAFYLQNNDRLPEAIDVYKKLNRFHPTYADAFFNTGILYLEMDSLDQATKHFDITINLEPAYALAYYYRGVTNDLKGQKEMALRDFEQALQLDPKLDKAEVAMKQLRKDLEL